MRLNDPTIKQSHVAKRLRIRHGHSTIAVKCDRTRQWITLWLLTLGVSVLFLYLTDLAGNSSAISTMNVVLVVGIADIFIISLYLAPGWRLVLDRQKYYCVFKRTYAGVPYHTRCVSFTDGPIGPCNARIFLIVEKEPPASIIGGLLLNLLGLFGFIIRLLARPGRSARSPSSQIAHLPAIFHYNELSEESTVLLVLEDMSERDRVLREFAEYLPGAVNL